MMRLKYPFSVVAAAVVWGCMGLIVRHLGDAGLETRDIVFLRALIATLLLGVFLAVTRPAELRIRLRDLWCFLGTGIVSLAFFNLCYFYTIRHASLSLAAILLYTSPVFILLLSAILFREHMTRRKWTAIALALGGCVLVTGVLTETVVPSPMTVLIGILSGVGYALYSIFARFALLRGYRTLTVCFYTFLFAAVGLSPAAGYSRIARALTGSPVVWGWLAALALLSSVIAYFLYTYGLSGMENAPASVLACVEPVTATLIGAAVYRELLSVTETVGVFLVLSAAILAGLESGGTEHRPMKGLTHHDKL